MLSHPSLDRLHMMGLTGMAKAFAELDRQGEAASLTHAEWLGLLLEREWSYRYDNTLGSVQLLILDDWGLEPLDEQARHDLLEILEERYGRRSTIVTSQIPVGSWHEVIGNPTYADAILDRLVHNAHRLELAGESLRRAKTRSEA